MSKEDKKIINEMLITIVCILDIVRPLNERETKAKQKAMKKVIKIDKMLKNKE